MSIYDTRRRYFEITGSLLPMIADYVAELEDYVKRRSAFITRFNAEDARVMQGFVECLYGLIWPADKDLPSGWRRDRTMRDTIVPDRRSKTGREYSKELQRISRPFPEAIFKKINVRDCYVGNGAVGSKFGCVMMTTTILKLNDKYVLSLPKSDQTDEGKWKPHSDLTEVPGWQIARLEHEGVEASRIA